MESKVSGFLKERMAPEILDGFMAPILMRSFATVLPFITEINKAHLVMLKAKGIVTPDIARQLAAVVGDLEKEGPDAFELDPALEETYFNYEAEVIRRLGSDLGGWLHVARSRNDLKSTQDKLRARGSALLMLKQVLDLRTVLIERSAEFIDTVMPGYTHMQPAQPISFGWYMLAIAHGLERDFGRLLASYDRINLSPLGAGALAGTSFQIDRAMTCRLLGFDRPAAHALDAIACRDAIIELTSACALLATTVGRMAQDFYVMSTHEVATVQFPDSLAITSSIMPQKKNMASLEHLKALPAQVSGALMSALAGYKATPYSHSEEGSLDGLRWVWDAFEEVTGALPAARLVAELAEPDRARMLELVRVNFSTATDLADTLVREHSLSFRDAHHIVGRVVRIAGSEKLAAHQISVRHVSEAAKDILGHAPDFDPGKIAMALDPEMVLESRIDTGSPSRADTTTLRRDAGAQLQADQAQFQARHEHVARASASLEREFNALASATA
ncbi:MAG: argininosuccinate lyase [Rhizobiaceae bacterium]|nr:MAG: argininosuccinate lyase [Rhizobiaceae bacterium]CAG0986462.1 argininosuccinate lyase [Rhizobiaceae bacterium]